MRKCWTGQSVGAVLLASFAVMPGIAVAQSNVEVDAAIEFNFSTPGARSLAMGGAFVGLADDATAAFTNPAGMTVLTRPEVSGELRHESYKQTFTDFGHGFGPPADAGFDTLEGLRPGEAQNSANSLAFVSFVYPREKWAAAVYRHQLANLKADFRTRGAFFTDPAGNVSRFFPVTAGLDLNIASYGGSFAYEVRPQLSVGASLSLVDFSFDSTTTRHGLVDPFFDEPDYSPDNVDSFQTQRGEDQDVVFSLGVIYQLRDRWKVGAAYRKGPEFTYQLANRSSGRPERDRDLQAPFHVPDVLALGVSFRATDRLTLSADYDRVTYSNLTEEVADAFGGFTDATRKLRAEDGNEVHVGGEFVVTELKWPLALRAGLFYDPAHRVFHLEGDGAMTLGDQLLALLFREGKGNIHLSGGAGLVFSRFQVDGAFSFSDRLKVFSVSSVVRF